MSHCLLFVCEVEIEADVTAIEKISDPNFDFSVKLNSYNFRTGDELKIEIDVNKDVQDYLVKNGYDPEYGARPVQRLIRREILAGLSRYLLEFPELNQVIVSMKDNDVQFHSAKLKQKAA